MCPKSDQNGSKHGHFGSQNDHLGPFVGPWGSLGGTWRSLGVPGGDWVLEHCRLAPWNVPSELSMMRKLFNEDGMDDIIFLQDMKKPFNQLLGFDSSLLNNNLKEAIGNLEKSLENIPQLDPSLLVESIKEMDTPTFELDDLLDKINEKGLDSLTPFEVDFLNKQSNQ